MGDYIAWFSACPKRHEFPCCILLPILRQVGFPGPLDQRCPGLSGLPPQTDPPRPQYRDELYQAWSQLRAGFFVPPRPRFEPW